MVIPEEEALDLIKTLISKHVPGCMDKNNILDTLAQAGMSLFKVPTKPCPKCKLEMVCPRCDEIEVDVGKPDVTIRVGSRIIYDS